MATVYGKSYKSSYRHWSMEQNIPISIGVAKTATLCEELES